MIWPVYSALWRSVLGACDFAIHIAGSTGTRKTELASLVQRHFGDAMDARHLPASWSSTANSLEITAFHAKDAILTVDDFNPTGGQVDIARFHKEAERLLRSQGNASGRGRLRPDGSLRPVKTPRGLILSTGEDIPKGHSLRSRFLIVAVPLSDVKLARLTECQRHAVAGLYAQAMAGFLAWVAPQYDQVVRDLKGEVARIRDLILTKVLLGSDGHGRTATIVGDLLAAVSVFLRFAVEVGAITDDEAKELRQRGKTAILAVARDQADHHADADPCRRYLTLLNSALSSWKCHVAKTDGECPLEAPALWGWRSDEFQPKDGPPIVTWRGQGPRIGWLDGDDLYLDPDAAYAAIQKLATEQGDAFSLTKNTLHKRLNERNLLVGVEPGHFTTRASIEGHRRRVLHLSAPHLLYVSENGPNGPVGPRSEKHGETGPLSGTAFPPAGSKRSSETVQEPLENKGPGPNGPLGPLPEPYTTPPEGREDEGPSSSKAGPSVSVPAARPQSQSQAEVASEVEWECNICWRRVTGLSCPDCGCEATAIVPSEEGGAR